MRYEIQANGRCQSAECACLLPISQTLIPDLLVPTLCVGTGTATLCVADGCLLRAGESDWRSHTRRGASPPGVPTQSVGTRHSLPSPLTTDRNQRNPVSVGQVCVSSPIPSADYCPTGRRVCQSVAASYMRAARSSRSSSNGGASSCRPTGKPAELNPHGTLTPGSPARFADTV